MKHPRTHTDQVFAELQTAGLNPVHAAMAQNIIDYRIRGPLPYEDHYKTELLNRITISSPDMAARVEMVFRNVGK
jgi:hypothetical protein